MSTQTSNPPPSPTVEASDLKSDKCEFKSHGGEDLPDFTPDARRVLRLAQWEAERGDMYCSVDHILAAFMILYGDDFPMRIQSAADNLKRQSMRK